MKAIARYSYVKELGIKYESELNTKTHKFNTELNCSILKIKLKRYREEK